MADWKDCKWGDLATLEYGKGLTNYLRTDGKYPVYGTNGKIGTADNFLCEVPSLIIGRKGAYRGVHYSREPFFVIDTAFYLKPKVVDLDMTFAYYQLLTIDINGMDSGSAIPSTSREDFYDIDISLPPLPEQQAIAEVLSSLDDKIDLLHRQNKTLESLAETLFRQWFVEEAEESWETKPLEQLCTITRGASPRPIIDYVINGTVPWIKIADATGSNTFFIDSTREFIIESGVNKSVKVSHGDLILSNSATCGFPYFVELEGCIHDGWLLFRDFKEISRFYAFFFLKQIYRELNNFADGSVQNNLNTGILKEYPVKVPPKNLVAKFNEEAGMFVDKIKRNVYQIRKLTKLRDELLPKLMSGDEVRVKSEK